MSGDGLDHATYAWSKAFRDNVGLVRWLADTVYRADLVGPNGVARGHPRDIEGAAIPAYVNAANGPVWAAMAPPLQAQAPVQLVKVDVLESTRSVLFVGACA